MKIPGLLATAVVAAAAEPATRVAVPDSVFSLFLITHGEIVLVVVAGALGSAIGVTRNSFGTIREVIATFLANVLMASTVVTVGPDVIARLTGDVFVWTSGFAKFLVTALLAMTAQIWGPRLQDAIGAAIGPLIHRLLPGLRKGEEK